MNARGWYSCLCPSHDDHRFSLSLKDAPRGVIAKCFASCSPATVHAAGREGATGPLPRRAAKPEIPQIDFRPNAERIWCGSRALFGTLVENYLHNSRHISLPIPPTLRFHPGLFHKETGTFPPAMV